MLYKLNTLEKAFNTKMARVSRKSGESFDLAQDREPAFGFYKNVISCQISVDFIGLAFY